MTASGTIQLVGARIVHHLRMTAVRLSSPGKTALDARGCQAGEFSLLPAAPVQGASC